MSALPEVRFHIYPTDCDMLGHLNHATMLNFLERARWALLEPQIDIKHWARQPVFSVVRHVDIDYLAQSLPGEDLLITKLDSICSSRAPTSSSSRSGTMDGPCACLTSGESCFRSGRTPSDALT